MKIQKQTWVIIILVILLVGAGCYIGIIKWNALQQEKQLGIFQQGAQYGYEQAVIQIAQQSATCQQVPLKVENQTINIVAVDCLQQAQAGENKL